MMFVHGTRANRSVQLGESKLNGLMRLPSMMGLVNFGDAMRCDADVRRTALLLYCWRLATGSQLLVG